MKKYDLAIVGAGLAGLSTAYLARKAGMSVIVLERGTVGSGASGGLVGALAPHMPEHWNEKKQYQMEAMKALSEFWGEIDQLSGLSSGYAQLGRLQNIPDERGLEKALMREEAAKTSWGEWGAWKVHHDDQHPFEKARFGYVRDDVSAQIMPRDAMKSLAIAARVKGVEIVENFHVKDIAPHEVFGTTRIIAQNIVIAAGHASWPWARPYLGADFGEGTKGQAALIRPKVAWNFPMVTGDGFYIVPHSPFQLAVGSTSERFWKHLDIDNKLDALLENVACACPCLSGAEIFDRWSGVRPRAFRPDPLIGSLDQGLFINSGGFKTGFSFAPKLAQDLLALIKGEPAHVPSNFLPNLKPS